MAQVISHSVAANSMAADFNTLSVKPRKEAPTKKEASLYPLEARSFPFHGWTFR